MAEKEEILKALSSVVDPDLNRDIVSLGFVKDVKICGGAVAATIELTTPACPVKDQLKGEAQQALLALPWVEEANIEMTANVRSTLKQPGQQGLAGVRNVIPVASGKGGVGKSTVSANLALALSRSGARVGLMDADIYGPSIPTLLGITERPVQGQGDQIMPVNRHGLKVISMGFFLPEDKAAIWRGPMLDKMIAQFLGGVEWGDLDYLVIDLPPGTGDVQLSLCQRVPLTGAVVVSTPQEVALNIAQKAISLFRQLNCPILGIVENMSGEVFGSGGAEKASQKMQIPFLGAIPLSAEIRVQSDRGEPIVVSASDSEVAGAFVRVAENLAAQVSIRGLTEQDITVSF